MGARLRALVRPAAGRRQPLRRLGARGFSPVPTLYTEDDRFVSVGDDFYSSDSYTDTLLRYLDERAPDDDRPFFAYLPFQAPHWPLQAPDESIAKYRGRYDEGPDVLRAERLAALKRLGLCPPDVTPHPVVADGAPEWADMTDEERARSARTMEVYAGMVDRMDYNVGRVIDYLSRSGELDNTVVIFLSDNGAEGAIVEAIAARPADRRADRKALRQQPGQPRPAHLVHLVRPALGAGGHRAVAAAQGVHHPGRHPGSRLHHLARLRPAGPDRHRVQHRHGHRADAAGTGRDQPSGHRLPGPRGGAHARPLIGRVSVRRRGHRSRRRHRNRMGAVRPPRHPSGQLEGAASAGPYGPGSWQLYDLASDPGEVDDLAAARPDKLAELLALWDRYVEETGVILDPISVFDAEL